MPTSSPTPISNASAGTITHERRNGRDSCNDLACSIARCGLFACHRVCRAVLDDVSFFSRTGRPRTWVRSRGVRRWRVDFRRLGNGTPFGSPGFFGQLSRVRPVACAWNVRGAFDPRGRCLDELHACSRPEHTGTSHGSFLEANEVVNAIFDRAFAIAATSGCPLPVTGADGVTSRHLTNGNAASR